MLRTALALANYPAVVCVYTIKLFPLHAFAYSKWFLPCVSSRGGRVLSLGAHSPSPRALEAAGAMQIFCVLCRFFVSSLCAGSSGLKSCLTLPVQGIETADASGVSGFCVCDLKVNETLLCSVSCSQ